MTVSPLCAVRSPGVSAVTFRGSNLGVAIATAGSVSLVWDRDCNGVEAIMAARAVGGGIALEVVPS